MGLLVFLVTIKGDNKIWVNLEVEIYKLNRLKLAHTERKEHNYE